MKCTQMRDCVEKVGSKEKWDGGGHIGIYPPWIIPTPYKGGMVSDAGVV